MHKSIFFIFITLIFILSGCVSSNKINNNDDSESGFDNNMEITMNITINGKKYNATLENNETVKAFVTMLPQEFDMNELNGNEKYIYMNNSLPTNHFNPKHIERGDIMLYGNNCLVVFYKSFDTNYSYTKIGHINDLPDLGSNNIIFKFETDTK